MMMSSQQITPSLRAVEEEMICLNFQIKELKREKKELVNSLIEYMEMNELEELEGYQIGKLKPKPRKKTIKIPEKSTKEKEKDGILLFKNIGITRPKQMYKEFIQTQNN